MSKNEHEVWGFESIRCLFETYYIQLKKVNTEMEIFQLVRIALDKVVESYKMTNEQYDCLVKWVNENYL